MKFQNFLDQYLKVPVEEFEHQVPESPLVSVCVQTYQHKEYIEDCLEGILNQKTNFEYEILLGEDDSTDGTREICIEYAEKYPEKIRLFLHKRENNIKIDGQPSGRFNSLFNKFNANGEFIATCEGDDYWIDPLKLQIQVDTLRKKGRQYVLSFHPVKVIDMNDDSSGKNLGFFSQKIKVLNVFEIITNNIPTVSAVYRSSVLKVYPDTYTQTPYGDVLTRALAASKGKAVYLPDVMAVRRRHGGGVYNSLNHKTKLNKSIRTREIILEMKELSNVHNYIKGNMLTLFKELIKIEENKQIRRTYLKKVNALILKSPSSLYYYSKIIMQRQLRRLKKFYV